MMNSDCAAGQTCGAVPSDPYLVKFGDAKIHTEWIPYEGASCLAAKAVYKIYVNGNWQTLESDFSENFGNRLGVHHG